jgi:uncharacterized circularly permuted ATP-grasp superfamily protein
VLHKAAADHDRLHERLDHERFAELFHDDHGIDRAAAKAAILFRERRREQTKLRELLPVLRLPAFVAARDLLEILEGVVVREKLRDGVAQKRLFFGEREIHCAF